MRTLQALERLAFADLSAPELAASMQLHPRTARRLLGNLLAEDYVTQVGDARRRYRPTMRLAALGRQIVRHADMPRTAVPWTMALHAQTTLPAHLWAPSYDSVVCLVHADDAPEPEAPEPQLRELLPAHASAPGKALLAHRTAWRESLLARSLQRHTDRTLTDPDELSAELDRVRADGYAADCGEHRAGVATVAAPVFMDNEAVAALGLTLTAPELMAAAPSLGRRVNHAAAALTAALDRPDRAH
jgi:DNA-binding IclR family transcriptional regulator